MVAKKKLLNTANDQALDKSTVLLGAHSPHRRGLPLRWRLVFLVLASILPLLSFTLYYQYSQYDDDIAATGTRTLTLARSLIELVDEQLQTRISALETLATSKALQEDDFDRFRPRAELVASRQFPGSNVVVLRPDGQVILSTRAPAAPLPVRPDLESITQVLNTGGPVVSNLFQTALAPHPVVAIDVPVKKTDGTILYILSLIPPLVGFTEVIDRQHLPADWVVSVFDRNGVIMARTPNGNRFIGSEASPSLIGALRTQTEGTLDTTSLEGTQLLTAFSHTKRFGWSVAIGVPKTQLTGPIVSEAIRTLAIGGVLLVLSLVLALYAARSIARPIDSLRRLAGVTSDGELPAPVATQLPEIDEVAQALHESEMARRQSQEAELALRDAIETLPQGFVIYDEQDRLVIWNNSYRRLFPEASGMLARGTPLGEVLRAIVASGRYPQIAGQEEAWIADQLRFQHGDDGTVEQRLADNRWLLVVRHGLANGWVARLYVDITGLKSTEEALRHSEMQHKRARQLAQLGSFVWDTRSDKVEWSDETYQIFGVNRDAFEPSRESVLGLVHPDDRARVLAITETVLGHKNPAPFEYRIVRPDNHIRHIYRGSEIIEDEAGSPRYLAGTFQDVTDRRRTEDQLRQAQKMEAIGNLTGGMAHDFNNLLGVVVGNLDLARGRLGDDDELHELIEEALDAAWRGADLTRRLLAFARRQPLRPARIEVNNLVNDTVRLLRRLLGEDIEVVLDLGTDLWPITADPAQLEASLANLATNARDAMPRGGRLFITTANRQLDDDYAAEHADVNPGDFVMIEVSDTGTGMNPETMNHIFEPFFTTKEAGKGTGLGLSMVFGFLRQSGGHVNVYSEEGVGTTFRLYLPHAIADNTATEIARAIVTLRGAGEIVLVVEDNTAMRRVSTRQLHELGYRVLECDRAAAALDILQHEHVDLLFTDIVMPGGLDGVELAHLAHERWPALKIVLTSGFPQARVNGDGGQLGTLQLLSKPYRKEELAAVLRAALGA